MKDCLGHWILEFSTDLGFGICSLGFFKLGIGKQIEIVVDFSESVGEKKNPNND